MLGLDTNILVRYLVRDDDSQFEKAREGLKVTGIHCRLSTE